MKKAAIFALAALTALAAATTLNAQRKTTVSGVVANADTRQNLIGVVIGFAPASDSTAVTSLVSGAGGAFSTGLTPGEYVVEASMLGYEKTRRRIEVGSRRTVLDTLLLHEGIVIDAVVKEAIALRTSLDGDTLIYNADAYKVAADASVSGLLEKMPGIKVDGQTVEAQGEVVKKILIDGREFFGEDVGAAISALPAEAVKSVEVFDKLSDNAEFTGIDDGEGYKAINITTRESMRQGVMGQVSALYGVEPPDKDNDSWNHYGLASGNINIFNGDARITIGGTINNLNERHFTFEDILGAGDDDGVATVGRFQFNYIDEWGKKNQWKFDASYSYNATDTDNLGEIDREYYDSKDWKNYSSDEWRERLNQNHAFRARLDFKPNQFHELRIRPFVRFQGSRSHTEGFATYTPIDGGDDVVTNNWDRRRETGWMAGANVNYRVRLGKAGRTLSLFFNGMYDPDDFTGSSYSERQAKDPDGTQQYVRQSTPSKNYEYDLRGGLTYTEPISTSSLINLDYSIGYNYSDNDRKSYKWDPSTGGDPRDPESGSYYTNPDPKLSGVYNSGYLTHRVGPGYRMQRGETTLSFGAFYQYSTLESTRELPIAAKFGPYRFNNITYAGMLNSKFGEDSSVRVFLHSMTRNPRVDDLQDVVDISDIQNIRKGDPDLKPSYSNRLYTRFIFPNTLKGRTLAFHLSGSYTTNAIAQRTVSESYGYIIEDYAGNTVARLDSVGRFSMPVNMNGQWSAEFGVDYGFPLTFMKSNLNVEAEIEYDQMPSQSGRWIDGMAAPLYTSNYSRTMEADGEITLGSNISERIDFRVSYQLSYNNVRNTAFGESNSDYLRHGVRADFKFVLPLEFTISGNMRFLDYQVLRGENFKQRYIIANAAVGKKIFRSRSGEVSLFVNDIFNQNVGFRRRAEARYIQNEINSVVGRYFGVKLTWNIRKFGKNGSQNIQMYNIDDGHGHGGHSGHRH